MSVGGEPSDRPRDGASTHDAVVPQPIMTAMAVSAVAWLLVMTLVLLVSGARPGVVPEGWRLELLKVAAVASFVAMLIGAGVAAVVLERRLRR